MARNYYLNGQCMVSYKGSQLGLTDGQGKVNIMPQFHYLPINVDGFFDCPPERQLTLVNVEISMTLVHFDIGVFESAAAAATSAGTQTEGTLPYGGMLMGANGGYGALSLSSPVIGNPFNFPAAFIKDHYELPIGAERSLLQVTWLALGFVNDPWNAGNGSSGIVVYT